MLIQSSIMSGVLGFLLTSSAFARQATAVASVAAGVVSGVTVTDGGSGYATAPAIRLSGGGGCASDQIMRQTPQELFECFQVQLQDLALILADEVMNGSLRIAQEKPPSAFAVRFSDGLILCLTDDSVKDSIRRDPEGARAFISTAGAVLREIKNGKLHLAGRKGVR